MGTKRDAIREVMDELAGAANISAITELVNVKRAFQGAPAVGERYVGTELSRNAARDIGTVRRTERGTYERVPETSWADAWKRDGLPDALKRAHDFVTQEGAVGFTRKALQASADISGPYAQAIIGDMAADGLVYDTGERMPGDTHPFTVWASTKLSDEDVVMANMGHIMTALDDEEIHRIAHQLDAVGDFDDQRINDRLSGRIINAIAELSGDRFLEMCQSWAAAQTADTKDRSD